MKILIKLWTITFLMAITNSVYTQSFMVRGGLNLSSLNINKSILNNSSIPEIKPGFHLGVLGEIPVYKMFSLETGLIINSKGFQSNRKSDSDRNGLTRNINYKLNLIYLDIPLTTKVSFNIGKAKIYGSFGPYLGVGLIGNSQNKFKDLDGNTQKNKTEVNWVSQKDNRSITQPNSLSRIDYGLFSSVGIEFKSIQIGLSYNHGLLNMVPLGDTDLKITNRVLSLSLGYRIFSKK